MSAPLVVETKDGSLLWVEGGLLWVSRSLSRGSGFAPWERVQESTDGLGIGGRVLTEAEVSRLVAPHGCGASR